MSRLDRRTLLRGASGVALGLPFLDAMTARAQTAPQFPKRLVILYQAQGVLMDDWMPTRAGDGSYTFGPLLESLTPFKDDMLLLTGIDDESCHLDGIAAHDRAPAHALTGARMAGSSWADAGTASLDHVIGQRISPPDLPLRSLHLGVSKPFEFSFSGARQPVDRRIDPVEVFQVLFGGFSQTDDPELLRRRANRQSVLDAVRNNARDLSRKLGAQDRAVVDSYLARVESIERRLNATLGARCQPTAPMLQRSPERERPRPADFDPIFDPDVSSRAMSDMAAMALACDRTRVVTMSWGQPDVYEWLRDANGDKIRSDDWHLEYVHVGGGTRANPSAQRDRLYRVQQHYQREMAYFLDQLRSVREGDGTLLDQCLVLYVNELGDGATHSHRGKPCFIAGRAGGAIEPGRWLEFDGVPHNRLLLSVLRAFGFDDPIFGEADLCGQGPLTGLV